MVSEAATLFKEIYKPTSSTLSLADLGVVGVYFVLIIIIGLCAMYRANRSTASGYFLAGRSMTWVTVGCSLFVSNIGSQHFIGLAGSGAGNGISVGAWEFNAILLLQLLGWIFVPVYIASGIYTMPEYLSKRFGGKRLRMYFAVISMILYILTKCSADLYTGALFIQQSLRWDLYLSISILVIITGVLTLTGGLTAVIYTDTLQAVLMIGGSLTLTIMAFYKIGGYDGLVRKYPLAMTNETFRIPNATCHIPDKDAFRMLREADDNYMPWLGFLLGQTPGSIWYWCTDQVIVQRLLAAKSISHAKGATLLAGLIKFLPLFLMVMPGMISRILYPDEVACVDPDICFEICQTRAGCTNIAYPRLVLGLMPEGLKGLMMAVMIAALMSDLDSIFNSASTLFTIDIYQNIRKKASEREKMIVSRIFIVVMVAVAIAWVPVVKETQGGQVFIYVNEIANYLAPPFAAVYLLAILVPRVNEKGAFWSLMIAMVIGITRMILVFVYQDTGDCLRPDPRPAFLKDFHYMYFALFITLLTAAIAVIISILTEKPTKEQLCRTTWWTRQQKEPDPDTADFNNITNISDNVEDIPLKESTVSCSEDHGGEESNEALKLDSEKPQSRTWLDIICGLQSQKASNESVKELEEHLRKVSQLRQNKVAKILLNIGLVAILALGTFNYIFFSLWQYTPSAP